MRPDCTLLVGNLSRVTIGSNCGIHSVMQPLCLVIAALILLRPDVAAVVCLLLLVLVRWLRSRRSRLFR